jgi:hypothetical protein
MALSRALGCLFLGAVVAVHAQDDSLPEPPADPAPPVALPSDDLLHPLWESQGVSFEARREFDRGLLRTSLAWQDSLGSLLLEVLDTSALALNPAPRRLDGDHGLHAALSSSLWGGTGIFSWQQVAQIEGQFADRAALAGSHTRGRIATGWSRPWGNLRTGAWGGMLFERDDPAEGTLSLVPGAEPHHGTLATAIASLEAGWSDPEFAGSRGLVGHVQRDAGDADLREESGSLNGSWTAPLERFGSLGARGSIDALRRRSEVLGLDRDVVRREADLVWETGLARQEITLSTGIADTLALDYTGRVPGQDGWGTWVSSSLRGDLPAGWNHRHDLSWAWSDRRVLDIEGSQNDLERSQSSRDDHLRLSDTLGWRIPARSGLDLSLGWQRSLTRRRHPQNPVPGPSDRPDQDVSETGIGFGLRDSSFARDDKPSFSWTWLRRDEVYLRSVRSAETRRREGHRLAADAAFEPADKIRLEVGSIAREQRTSYRFDSTRDEGLMEWQADVALQEGPAARPNLRAWADYRLTWSGDLQGEDFAVERRTVLVKPGARLWWRPLAGLSVSPWIERWIETSKLWDGMEMADAPRQSEWRVALDTDYAKDAGRAHLSVVRVMSDPGTDDWRVLAEGGWAW